MVFVLAGLAAKVTMAYLRMAGYATPSELIEVAPISAWPSRCPRDTDKWAQAFEATPAGMAEERTMAIFLSEYA
jgi:hypothetical protein